MRIAVLHNYDFAHLPEGVSRRSQDEVVGVAEAFARSLARRRQKVQVFPVTGEEPLAFLPELARFRPDVAVNLCESLAGDPRLEMIVPGLLELAGVPHTGSAPLALGLALHKHKAKEVLRGVGVPTPAFALVERPSQLASLSVPLPAIVKPAREDASIGIDRKSVVHDGEELGRAVRRVLRTYHQPALVEQYIEGRELNVGLFGDPPQVLPVAEIDFSALDPSHPRIVTYAAKWDESAPEYHATPPVPCKLPKPVLRRVSEVARAAFLALDLRDYGRVDMRLAADGTPYVIEVNPNCDLAQDAGFAKAAARAGISYDDLVWRLVNLAKARGS